LSEAERGRDLGAEKQSVSVVRAAFGLLACAQAGSMVPARE
jgi:hypothetical protein